MVNLLPQQARSSVVLSYRLRLGAVIAGMLCAAFLIALCALAPSYFFAVAVSQDLMRQGLIADQSLSQQNLADAAEQEHAGEVLATAVRAQNAIPRPSKALLALLAQKPAGVSVLTVNYTSGPAAATISLSGTASTRDELLAFKQALSSTAGVKTVDLPIDALASATDIEFSMNVTYADPTSAPK